MADGVTPRFQSGGTLRAGALYVERPADEELPAALLAGDFCYILAPRQIGKSSLRVRTTQHLQKRSVRCATIDLTTIGSSDVTPEQWYFSLLQETASALTLTQDLNAFWSQHANLTPVHRFSRFLRQVLLEKIQEPIVLFIDEIDNTRTLPFSADDFFAAIRAVYNARPEDAVYQRLTFCLIGLAAPADLVQDERKTPFNIGRSIRIEDFTSEQAQAFLPGLSEAGGDAGLLLGAVLDWTAGHPYMTQRLCEALVLEAGGEGSERERAEALVDTLFLQRGRTEDLSLAYAEKRFAGYDRETPDPLIRRMLQLYRRLLSGDAVPTNNSDEVQLKLRLTGMAAERQEGNHSYLRVRNRIFASVFNLDWVREHEPATLLTEPVARWLEAGRKEDYVLRGAALTEALAWAEGRNDVTADELDFLLAGQAVAKREETERQQRERAEEEARQKADIERVRRERAETIARLQKRALIVLGTILAVLAASLVYNLWQGVQAARLGKTAAGFKKAADEAQKRKVALEQSVSTLTSQQESLKNQNTALKGQITTLTGQTQNLTTQKNSLTRANETLKGANSTLGQKNQALSATQKGLEEQNFMAERRVYGLQATSLAQQPGNDVQALVLGVEAVAPCLKQKPKRTPPPEAIEGLTSAVNQARYLAEFRGHSGWVTSASFSPDGSRVVTASTDGTARLWDGHTGKALAVLTGHFGPITSASFSPDGSRVVTASTDGTARLWDGHTGKAMAVLTGHTDVVNSASFSSDGSRVVTAGGRLLIKTNREVVKKSSKDNTARLWDGHTGKPLAVLTGHSDLVFSASFSPDGSRVITASADHTARLWDGHTGKELAVLTGHFGTIYSASFSPDGSRVVTASEDNTARLWDGHTGKQRAVLTEHTDSVFSASFSPDGSRVVTASKDNTARLWDGHTGKELAVLTGHFGTIFSASFSPDGSRVVTGSTDGTARLWDEHTGKAMAVLTGHTDSVFSASFSPDGSRVVTASFDHTARLWDGHRGKPLAVLTGHSGTIYSASFSPDGSRVVTASEDHTARLWDGHTGKQRAMLTGRTGKRVERLPGRLPWHDELIYSASFSPDGSRVVTTSADHTARLWDGHRGKPLAVLTGHSGTIFSASFSPDGSRVVTTSADHTARLWDGHTGKELAVLTGHSEPIYSASFSPDGSRVVTASEDNTACLWDGHTGKPLAVLTGHTDQVTSASFSPDGSRVVTASGDHTARLWDGHTGRELALLTGHNIWVNSASFSPDGSRVVTASDDHTARLWDGHTGKPLAVLTGHTDQVTSASFSPDGSRVVTACEDGTARLWDGHTGKPLAVLTGHSEPIYSASFSPDGDRVITASGDGTARIFSVRIEDYLAKARELLRYHPEAYRQVEQYFEPMPEGKTR